MKLFILGVINNAPTSKLFNDIIFCRGVSGNALHNLKEM